MTQIVSSEIGRLASRGLVAPLRTVQAGEAVRMSASTARPVAASSASPASKDLGGTPRRFDSLDVARGGALLAMAAYHTTWDLGHLALTPENYALAPLGKFAAHLIAGTFLVLVGIGLVLMNRDGLRPRASSCVSRGSASPPSSSRPRPSTRFRTASSSSASCIASPCRACSPCRSCGCRRPSHWWWGSSFWRRRP